MTAVRRIAVRGVIYKDGKLFCQKLIDKHSKQINDFWCTPGGGLDDGEDIISGLRREMIEETGIEPQIGRLLFVQQYNDNGREQMEFFFHITNPEDYATIDLAGTSHGLLEVHQCEFVSPQDSNILPDFLQNINLQKYIETVQPVFIYNQQA